MVAPPPTAGQDTIVYFFGETVEKIGPRKYKIVERRLHHLRPADAADGISHADTIVLNLDHYTLLQTVVMTVKGVPLFYLPVLYYPTKREDRATGFLLPTYGTSTLRGQSLHNAFFWAINRSQDATLLHDWFSKTGQGVGSRVPLQLRRRIGWRRPRLFAQSSIATDAGRSARWRRKRSYKISGSANELLPWPAPRAGAASTTSPSIVTNQTFNTNINNASQQPAQLRRQRGRRVGQLLAERHARSRPSTSPARPVPIVTGSWPRVTVIRNERPVGDTPLYVSAGGEYAHILSDRPGRRQLNSTEA